MNALAIIKQAADELGLPRPSTLAATDPSTVQFLALANAHGNFLMTKHPWTALQALATFATVNGTSDYDVATDFDRFIDDTQWDRTNAWRLIGPISPQFDRFRRETLGATIGPRRSIRLIGTSIRVNPTPTVDGDVLVYEYVSNNWARTSGAVAKAAITLDTDLTVYDPWLMIYGIKYRFRHAKGLDSETFKEEHDDYLDLRKAGDIGVGTINMGANDMEPGFLSLQNVPDTGFGA